MNVKAGEGKNRQYDLEERLIDFAVLVIETANRIPSTRAGNHLGGQLIRSGTAPALHYGEAQGAESRKDFIHKMKIALKELRESQINLKSLKGRNFSILPMKKLLRNAGNWYKFSPAVSKLPNATYSRNKILLHFTFIILHLLFLFQSFISS